MYYSHINQHWSIWHKDLGDVLFWKIKVKSICYFSSCSRILAAERAALMLVLLPWFCSWELYGIISKGWGTLPIWMIRHQQAFYGIPSIWLKFLLLHFLEMWLLYKCAGITFYKGAKNIAEVYKHNEIRDVERDMYKSLQFTFITFTMQWHLTFSETVLNEKKTFNILNMPSERYCLDSE